MASASIMTELAKGRIAREAKTLLQKFVAMLDGHILAADDLNLGLLALLETVRRFPTRTGCAALPWKTLESVLEDYENAVSVN